MTNSKLFAIVMAATCLLILANDAGASRLEQDLARRLNGAWVIMMTEGYSNCDGFYNNNEANLSGVTSKAKRRFAPGEIAKIDKINLKRSRLDLFITLGEPILVSRIEGPFELFDQRECKIQLQIPMARELVKAGDSDPILGEVARLVEIHASARSAESSITYNGRERADYPEDYELTLARFEVWKAEQLNAAVADRLAAANYDARAVATEIRRDKQYLDGFGAGVEEMRQWRESDCGRLVGLSFSSVFDRPPSDKTSTWKEGYSDGQELIFNLFLAERLQGCFVPVPPMP